MDFLIETVAREWKVITEAPLTIVALAVLIYLLVRWRGTVQHAQGYADRDARIALREDELARYRSGTNTDSPDEAKRLVEDLENRLRASDPRTLSGEQEEALLVGLSKGKGSMSLTRDGGSYGTDRLLGQLERAFTLAEWEVSGGFFLTTGTNRNRELPQSGLLLSVYRDGDAWADYLTAKQAFIDADIPCDFDEKAGQRPRRGDDEQADWINLTVTLPANKS